MDPFLDQRVSPTLFIKVARALLAASEAERQLGVRDREGRRVLISSKDLGDRIHEKKADSLAIIQLFTMMGYVDCIPGKNIKKSEVYKEAWKSMVDESVMHMLVPYCPSVNKKSLDGISGTAAMEKTLKEDGKKWTIGMNDVINYLIALDRDNSLWSRAVDNWLRFIWNADTVWKYAMHPSFFVIVDPAMLHRIVIGNNEILDQIIEHQYNANLKIKGKHRCDSLEYATQHEKGRMHFFINSFKEFLINDAKKNEGRLNFSGRPWGCEKERPVPER